MKTKRDVLFLCQYFHPEYVSSATLPSETAFSLAKEGLTVSALCGYPKEYSIEADVPSREVIEKVSVRRLRYFQLKRSNTVGRLINYLSFTISVFFHFFYLRSFRMIIVYSNPPILPLVAVWAKKIFGCKLAFVAYDLYPEIAKVTLTIKEGSSIDKMMQLVNRRLYSACDAVVALSSDMKEFLIEHRRIDSSVVHVIPNWYSDKKSEQNSRKLSENVFFNDFQNQFVVSYLGNMGVCQDMDTIVQAIRLLKSDGKVSFLLAGHGVKHSQVGRVLEKEGLENAKLFGFLHGQDYLDALAISNCTVVSLIGGMRGLSSPSKSYACMMMGKPVIFIGEHSSEHANQEKVHETSDYSIVIDNGDAEALVKAILSYATNLEKQFHDGETARAMYLLAYTPQVSQQKYCLLVRGLLG